MKRTDCDEFQRTAAPFELGPDGGEVGEPVSGDGERAALVGQGPGKGVIRAIALTCGE